MKHRYRCSRPFSSVHFLLSSLLFWTGFSPAHAQNWTSSPSGISEHLNGVFITTDGTGAVAVGNGGTVLSFDGTNWSPVPGAPDVDFLDVHGTRTDYFAAGGIDELWHYSNGVWNVLATNAPGEAAYTPVHVSADESNIWFQQFNTSAGSFPFHFLFTTGSEWGFANFDPILAFAQDGADVRYVNDEGKIDRADAVLVETNLFNTTPIYSLTAAWFVPGDLDQVFAIRNESQVYHFNGSAWTDMNAGLTERLIWLGGTATNDLYVIGVNTTTGDGVMHHYDGSLWSPVTLPAGFNGLIDIAFPPPPPAGPLAASLQVPVAGAQGNQPIGPIVVGEFGKVAILTVAILYAVVFIKEFSLQSNLSIINMTLGALAPGQFYTVLQTESLTNPNWQTLANGIPGTGNDLILSLAIIATTPHLFFKVLSSAHDPNQ